MTIAKHMAWQENKFIYKFRAQCIASDSDLGPASRYSDILEANQLSEGFSVIMDSKPVMGLEKSFLSVRPLYPVVATIVQPITLNEIY